MSFSIRVLATIVAVCCLRVHAEMNYECYPNGTVAVQNPDFFTNGFANNSETICTTSMSDGYGSLIIQNCAKELPILVTFHNTSTTALLGGKGAHSSMVNCLEIDVLGVTKDFTHLFNPEVGHTQQTTVHPIFGISSQIYTDNTTNVVATESEVGEPLFWVITGYGIYDYKPVECTAYKGMVVDPSVTKKVIIVEGCTADSSLVQSFQFSSGGGMTIFTIINAFRFYGSDYITLECITRICPTGAAACAISCSDRKKRDVAASKENRRSVSEVSTGDAYSNVVARLKVKVPRERADIRLDLYTSGKSSTGTGSMWLVIVVFAVGYLV